MHSLFPIHDDELYQLPNTSNAEILQIKDSNRLKELSKQIGLHVEMQAAYSRYFEKLVVIKQTANGDDAKIFEQVCVSLGRDLDIEAVIFEDEAFDDFEKSRKAEAEKAEAENSLPNPVKTGNLFYQKMIEAKSKFSSYLSDIAAYYYQYIGTTTLSEYIFSKMNDPGKKYELRLLTNQYEQTQRYKLDGDKVLISSSVSFICKHNTTGSTYDIFEGESASLEMSLENDNSLSELDGTTKKQFDLLGFSTTGPFIYLAVFGNPEIINDLWALLNQNILIKKHAESLPDSEKESLGKIRQEKIIEIKKALSENDNLNKILEGKCKLHDVPAISDFLSFAKTLNIPEPVVKKPNSNNKIVKKPESPQSNLQKTVVNSIRDVGKEPEENLQSKVSLKKFAVAGFVVGGAAAGGVGISWMFAAGVLGTIATIATGGMFAAVVVAAALLTAVAFVVMAKIGTSQKCSTPFFSAKENEEIVTRDLAAQV